MGTETAAIGICGGDDGGTVTTGSATAAGSGGNSGLCFCIKARESLMDGVAGDNDMRDGDVDDGDAGAVDGGDRQVADKPARDFPRGVLASRGITFFVTAPFKVVWR